MRRSIAVLVLIVLLGGLAVANEPAESDAGRRLVVQVSNGTSDGTTVVGDPVTVQLYRGQMPANSLEAVVNETGEAVFDTLPAGSDLVAVPRARHQNMAFGGQPVRLASSSGDVTASVTVFDVSSDVSALSVGMHHIVVSLQAGSLVFTEYFQLKNDSDMAVTGAKRDAQNKPMVIDVGLPKGFSKLQALDYLEQNALVTTPTGFYDTMAVPPGEHQVTFSYQLGIKHSSMSIARRISLPTSELLVFWKGGQGAIEGLGEPAGEMTSSDGVPMTYYQQVNLAAGDEVRFKISGLAPSDSDTTMWIVLGVVFAAVAVIAVRRLRSSSGQGEPGR